MPSPTLPPVAKARPRRPGDIPVAEIVEWVRRWKFALVIGAGVLLRLVAYLTNRVFWMDEFSLAGNLQALGPLGFFGPLYSDQIAPPGFLVACWSAVQLLGDNRLAMRLIPFAGGVLGLFLFLAVARRCLPPRAVLPALLMFAVANDPIYYSAELKQYSTDLAASLACLLVALTIGSRPLTASNSAWLAFGGAALAWFSHPSVFVLASVGVVGLARAVGARDGRGVVSWALVGASWLASFAAARAVSIRQLGGSDMMWRFWDFAFPPIPPRSFWDATWVARRLALYFVNPLNFDGPFGGRLSMLPAIGLAALGVVRLWKIDRGRWILLMLPVGFTLLASAWRLYPFHGRVVLFLAPIPLLAIAEGLDAVRESLGRGWIYYALAAMVLAVPAEFALEQVFHPRYSHNRLGDLHPDIIDPYRFPF